MLTQEQVETYHANGYIGVEDVLSPEEIEKLRMVTDEFVDRSRHVSTNNDDYDLEPGHSAEEPRLRRLKHPETLHPTYNHIFHDRRILDLVEQLIGPNIRHFSGKLNIKSAGFGSPVEWHQDYAFCARTNEDILAVGVAIDDMTLENGCLLVVPGSHKGPIYNHYQSNVFVGAVTEDDFGTENAVPVELKAGGVSIHHGTMLHASAPNTCPTLSRRLYLLQYCAADAWPIKNPPQDMQEFDKNIIRGNRVLKPRYTDVPKVPEPDEIEPAPLSGSIYESQSLLNRPMVVNRKN